MRGLCIAMGQYSSLCGCALGLIPGGDDIEDGVPDREQADSERENVEVRDKEKGDKTRKQPTHAQTRDTMDGMWME